MGKRSFSSTLHCGFDNDGRGKRETASSQKGGVVESNGSNKSLEICGVVFVTCIRSVGEFGPWSAGAAKGHALTALMIS